MRDHAVVASKSLSGRLSAGIALGNENRRLICDSNHGPRLQDSCGLRPGPGCLPRFTSRRRSGDSEAAGAQAPDPRPVEATVAKSAGTRDSLARFYSGMGPCRRCYVAGVGGIIHNSAAAIAEALDEAHGAVLLAPTVPLPGIPWY